ncbi:cation diffusion facilitator family transporter [Liberiplasma polymorphum]|uniref:cation diffusion facilitator family transporter n=1 Tax=Liberiplasma polymorphum TaxID=3374570 RepID=UPI00377450D2
MKHSKVMRKSLLVNTLLVITKIFTGFLFKSTALIADGIHSLSDLMSDVFVLVGLKQATKPPDDEHPFGHGKLEYVLSMLLGLSILVVAYQLVRNVVVNFRNELTTPSLLTIYVVIFVVVSKFILSRYLISRGNALESQVILASGKESFTDVVSSIIVFVGVVASVLGDRYGINWLRYGDNAAGIVIGIFIVKVALEIIIDAVRSLLGKSAKPELLASIKSSVEALEGVLGVDHLDMIEFGYYYQVMIDIAVDASITVKEGHDVASKVKRHLKTKENILHVIVHVNPKE